MNQVRRAGRAAPMAPDERRQMIVDAVVPLLTTEAPDVSTKAIAEAAGIAEGTIFGVFEDKAELLRAAADRVLNPPDAAAQHAASLAGLTSLRDQVRVTAERMVERSERSMGVLMALRRQMMRQPHADGHKVDPQSIFQRSAQTAHAMLVDLFEAHADELSVDPETAAVLLRTLVLGSRHPGHDAARRLTPAQITDALLDGVLVPDSSQRTSPPLDRREER